MFVQNSQVGKHLDKAWTYYEQVEEDRLTKTDITSVRPLIHSQIVKWPQHICCICGDELHGVVCRIGTCVTCTHTYTLCTHLIHTPARELGDNERAAKFYENFVETATLGQMRVCRN